MGENLPHPPGVSEVSYGIGPGALGGVSYAQALREHGEKSKESRSGEQKHQGVISKFSALASPSSDLLWGKQERHERSNKSSRSCVRRS